MGKNEELALALDICVLKTKKDGWKETPIKTKAVRIAITNVLKIYSITKETDIHRIFNIVKSQPEY
ncbi:hypothetical protein [Arachidicoccus ginsenosidivorans]|uniref:hypothetical protein n=1 Tax=Arachidicoccus ginsenosidivorans TaxID=496057 RepID=UPI001CEF5BCE|nr:hypothetical protein [Arachidicoccus ginsenosidivorans]